MNVVRSYSNEGKTLQELMEILLPIIILSLIDSIEIMEKNTIKINYKFANM